MNIMRRGRKSKEENNNGEENAVKGKKNVN